MVSRLFASFRCVKPRARCLIGLAYSQPSFIESSLGGNVWSSVERTPHRHFCIGSAADREKKRDCSDEVVGWKVPSLVDETLRGVGQVLFCNSAASGAIILVGLAVGDPWLAALAGVGTVSATAFARVAGIEKEFIANGLAGYNGCLVGCAFSVFLSLPAWSPCAAVATAAGGVASTALAVALKNGMTSVPQWTLAFNITTLAALAYVKPLAAAPGAAVAAVAAKAASELTMYEWVAASLTGISQIFVVNDPLVGALVLAGIVVYSRGCAAFTLLGSMIGTAVAVVIGVDATEIQAGLWGFNSALTSLAVSVFFVPTAASLSLAASGAAATAILFAGLKTAMGDAFALPALTLPFCAVASACHLLRGSIRGVVPSARPHSPEMNSAH